MFSSRAGCEQGVPLPLPSGHRSAFGPTWRPTHSPSSCGCPGPCGHPWVVASSEQVRFASCLSPASAVRNRNSLPPHPPQARARTAVSEVKATVTVRCSGPPHRPAAWGGGPSKFTCPLRLQSHSVLLRCDPVCLLTPTVPSPRHRGPSPGPTFPKSQLGS